MSAPEHRPPARFDELVHAPTRLAIMSLLAALRWAEFGAVRDGVGLSDSALSKQVAVLERAGYLSVRKGYVGKRPRTWLRLSPAGRRALAGHVAALQEIIDRANGAGADADAPAGDGPEGARPGD